MQFGKLSRLDPRDVWPHEALQFTPWLAENLSALGEALGIDLELSSTEAPVGGFSLDILARDLNHDRVVVIENQLTRTDHDHLGKLLTYASGHDAQVVVWIASEIREEHRQALDWLNNRTDSDANFFGVVVEVLKIDDSLPAPNFKLVASPNQWFKQVKQPPQTISVKGEAYRAFFQTLIDRLRVEQNFTNAKAASATNWYAFASGIRGVQYGANFTGSSQARVEIYLDTGEQESTKIIFDSAEARRGEFEAAFGAALSWERLDERRASRIAVYRPGRIQDEAQLGEIEDWMIENLLRMRNVFGGPLKAIVTELALATQIPMTGVGDEDLLTAPS
jgi:hypothetical protein